MEEKSTYIFAAQSGGGDKTKKFYNLFYEFKKPIEQYFLKEYSIIIKELSIIFRIDGKFSSWGEKGINRLRLMKSQNYITIDIGITEDILDLPDKDILIFIRQEFEKATNVMLEKIKKSKIEFNFEEFNADFVLFKKTHFE